VGGAASNPVESRFEALHEGTLTLLSGEKKNSSCCFGGGRDPIRRRSSGTPLCARQLRQRVGAIQGQSMHITSRRRSASQDRSDLGRIEKTRRGLPWFQSQRDVLRSIGGGRLSRSVPLALQTTASLSAALQTTASLSAPLGSRRKSSFFIVVIHQPCGSAAASGVPSQVARLVRRVPS
jgi:hypothetical protein